MIFLSNIFQRIFHIKYFTIFLKRNFQTHYEFHFFCASDGQWGYCKTDEEDTSKEEEEGGEGGGGGPKDEGDSSGKLCVPYDHESF